MSLGQDGKDKDESDNKRRRARRILPGKDCCQKNTKEKGAFIDLKLEDVILIVFHFQVEYFVKWIGYPDSENTWEPAENLQMFPLLIKAFEENQKIADSQQLEIPESPPVTILSSQSLNSISFSKVHTAERIIGVTRNEKGELMVLIKWKGSTEANFIPSKQARDICPKLLIQFYEDRLVFKQAS